jgi:hypothetical protein
MTDARRGLLERIEADRDRLVGFLQAFTRIDTANPPGDTRAGAAFIGDFLDRAGLPYRRIAPRETMPNLLAATRFAGPAATWCSTATSTSSRPGIARAGRTTRSPA